MSLNDQKNQSEDEKDLPSAENLALEERKRLREMEALALSKAFSLRHGWGEPADSAEFDHAARRLRETLEARSQELATLADKALDEENKQRAQITKRETFLNAEDLIDNLTDSIHILNNTIKVWSESPITSVSAPTALELLSSEFERTEKKHTATMDFWAFRSLKALGVIDALADPERRKTWAALIGQQKSQEELKATSEGLVNRVKHYSIAPLRDSNGLFKSFETVDLKAHKSVLVNDLPDPQRRFQKATVFSSFGPRDRFFPGQGLGVSEASRRIALALLCPRGGVVDAHALQPTPSEFLFFGNEKLTSKITKAARQTALEARWCDMGSPVLACVSAAVTARDLLRQPLSHLLELANEGEDLCAQDKARRVCEWFDDVAGEKASELALKVWGGSVPSGMRLGELETLAKFNKELWASLEGQEALGLFSIRMADELGLELSGRDLPERAKQKMKELGLTDGGWRLLGKMDASPKSSVAQWLGVVNSESNKDSLSHEMLHVQLLSLHINGASQEQIQQKMEEAQAQQKKQDLVLVSKALSACAARGLDPASAESAIQTLFESRYSRDIVFGSQLEAPEGARAAEIETEERAKELRSPRILSDWLSLASKNPDKAKEALSQASDWARDAEWGVWSQMPENAGWQEVMTRQKHWHEMLQARERSEKETISWDGMSPGWSDPQTGFSAVPLTNGGMLWDEGKAMHHCVSSYTEDCESGKSRIFSIRKDGERFGTAEIRISDGSFKVVQFKGAYNKSIEDERAWSAANAAAAQCKSAAGFLVDDRVSLNLQEDQAIALRLRQRALADIYPIEPAAPRP